MEIRWRQERGQNDNSERQPTSTRAGFACNAPTFHACFCPSRFNLIVPSLYSCTPTLPPTLTYTPTLLRVSLRPWKRPSPRSLERDLERVGEREREREYEEERRREREREREGERERERESEGERECERESESERLLRRPLLTSLPLLLPRPPKLPSGEGERALGLGSNLFPARAPLSDISHPSLP
eukprot:1159367-Pelagomonas_calceolata.AAC.1